MCALVFILHSLAGEVEDSIMERAPVTQWASPSPALALVSRIPSCDQASVFLSAIWGS